MQELKEQHEEKLAQLKLAHSKEIAACTQQLDQLRNKEGQLRDDTLRELREVRSELQRTRAANDDIHDNKLRPAQVRLSLPPLAASSLFILTYATRFNCAAIKEDRALVNDVCVKKRSSSIMKHCVVTELSIVCSLRENFVAFMLFFQPCCSALFF
jgi:hypothetical protein